MSKFNNLSRQSNEGKDHLQFSNSLFLNFLVCRKHAKSRLIFSQIQINLILKKNSHHLKSTKQQKQKGLKTQEKPIKWLNTIDPLFFLDFTTLKNRSFAFQIYFQNYSKLLKSAIVSANLKFNVFKRLN